MSVRPLEKPMRIVKLHALLPDQSSVRIKELNYLITKTVKRYTRNELAAELNLTLRDIRNLLIVVSMIEPREYSVIISLGAINAIVYQDSFYLLLEDAVIEEFYNSFENIFYTVLNMERQSQFEHSWELLCLETVLYYQTNNLKQQYEDAKKITEDVMDMAETTYGHGRLIHCQQLLTQINTDCQRANLTLENLLDSDLDVAQLSFLNQKMIFNQKKQFTNEFYEQFKQKIDLRSLPFDFDLIADMLGFYLFQIRALTLESQELFNLIKNKLDLAQLNLDNNRNKLMIFELKLTLLSCALDLACMFGGLYGMNVKVPLDNTNYGFFLIIGLIIAISIIFYGSLLIVQKLLERKNLSQKSRVS